MCREYNPKCYECAFINPLVFRRSEKPDCYNIKTCSRKRSYYRNWKANKDRQIKAHRYLKYKGNKCVICGDKQVLEVHHIKPQCKEGLDTKRNTITLCNSCHKVITSYYKVVGWC